MGADDAPTAETIGVAPTIESPSDELGSAASLLLGLAAAPGRQPSGPLVCGQVVAGKYRVETAIGAGGMGVVYRARDARLDRDVAIKVCSTVSAPALARLEREAQALARLSHPNVVVVFEVGEIDGHVFIVMELVAGGTARAWLRAEPRTTREIIALYCAAGDGLAAAHAAGIVHRDFKPDNVLVGDDGRPRVADFGLARGATDHEARDPDRGPAPLAEVTRAGTVVGTPAYMPPEQLAGDVVDARADQFAFCAALWESLYGARPFAGETPDEVRTAIESTEPRAVSGPRARKVPPRVATALRRGLSPAPADRWPELAALLVELRRPVHRRRNLAIAASASGAIAVAAIAAVIAVPRFASTSATDPCAGGDARLANAWDASRAGAVRAAFAGLHLDWAARNGDAASAALDADARAWIAADRAVCEARGMSWTDRLRERALSCLAQRRDDIAAAASVLAAADTNVAARARGLIGALASPGECADPTYVATEVAPPSDPRVAAAAAPLRAQHSRVRSLIGAGRLDEARRVAETLLPEAIALGYPPLVAQAHGDLGATLETADADKEASRELAEAYYGARAAHDTRTAILAASDNVQAKLGVARLDDAVEWARLADAEAHDTADPELRFAAASAQITVARSQRDPRALELANAHVTAAGALPDPQHLAYALKQRASVRRDRGDFDASIADLEEAMRVIRAAYGDDDASLVSMGSQLAYAMRQTGRDDQAATTARAALALAERLFGVDSKLSMQPLGILADALAAAGNDAEAASIWEHVIRLDTKYRGAVSPEIGSDLNNYGIVLTSLHRVDDAVATLTRARDTFVSLDGADAASVATVLGNLAEAQLAGARLADAEATCDRAIAILSKVDDDVTLGYVLTARGIARLGRRAYADARADLERALVIRGRPDVDPGLVAKTTYYLAETLAAQGDVAAARTRLRPVLPALRTLADPEMLRGVEALARKLGLAHP